MRNPRTNISGLSKTEAKNRLERFGPNRLHAHKRTSVFGVLIRQFRNVLIVILLAAICVSGFLGHGFEAVAISIIVVFSVVFGFVQEYRAEHALLALHKLTAPGSTVIRDAIEQEIPSEEIVPGDIIVLNIGDVVSADAVLVEAINLHVQESALTGESVPVHKTVSENVDTSHIPEEKSKLIFAGTTVVVGRGLARVYATGMKTEFGKIAGALAEVREPQTPLQKNLDIVGRRLGMAAIVVMVIIVTVGLIRGAELYPMLLLGIALAVAVVPEALPAVVTVTLALGVQRLVRRKALVRRLAAVETLGSTSVICTDKTGTLTRDEMTLRVIVTNNSRIEVTGSGYATEGDFLSDGHSVPAKRTVSVLKSAILASDATTDKGDPTERAIVVAGVKAGLSKQTLDEQYRRINEESFTAESRRMITVHEDVSGFLINVKGAPEAVVGMCTSEQRGENYTILNELRKTELLGTSAQLATEAFRVLAVAAKSADIPSDLETGYTFLGFIGLIDPPRDEVYDALKTCEGAGIRVLMVTGDHPITARAIASDLGVFNVNTVVTGDELESMTDLQLRNTLQHTDVFARVAPIQKLRIVDALQSLGATVAMTGDGVNDAPALRKADIGVAMGVKGTDVARETAAMTLSDDNFASIVAAVEEGRRIFNNIKKFLMFLLSSNIGEIGVMLVAVLAGLPMPLSAVQLLYINLATDGLPALSLAVDPSEQGMMRRRPRTSRGIFTARVVGLMMIGGIWSTIINISLFIWALNNGKSYIEAVTMTFVSLIFIQFFKAYAFRSDTVSTFVKPFENKWLNAAIIWEVALLSLIVYLPSLQPMFGTISLSLADWLLVSLCAGTVLPVLEIVKRVWKEPV